MPILSSRIGFIVLLVSRCGKELGGSISFSLPLADTLLRRDSPNSDDNKEESASRLSLRAEISVGAVDDSQKTVGFKIVELSGIAHGAWWSENEAGVSLFSLA